MGKSMTIAMPSADLLEPYDEGFIPNVEESPLGDGYKRVEPKGINAVRRKYSLRWVAMSVEDAHAIRDALAATKFQETITWTPPFETEQINLRLTKKLTIKWLVGGEKQVSATFEEDF